MLICHVYILTIINTNPLNGVDSSRVIFTVFHKLYTVLMICPLYEKVDSLDLAKLQCSLEIPDDAGDLAQRILLCSSYLRACNSTTPHLVMILWRILFHGLGFKFIFFFSISKSKSISKSYHSELFAYRVTHLSPVLTWKILTFKILKQLGDYHQSPSDW